MDAFEETLMVDAYPKTRNVSLRFFPIKMYIFFFVYPVSEDAYFGFHQQCRIIDQIMRRAGIS